MLGNVRCRTGWLCLTITHVASCKVHKTACFTITHVASWEKRGLAVVRQRSVAMPHGSVLHDHSRRILRF